MWSSVGRLLLVLLPLSAVGTAILAAVLPETAWPTAALGVTVLLSLSLALSQVRRAWERQGRDTSLLTISFLEAMGAGAADRDGVRELDRRLRENLGRWVAFYVTAAALGAVLLRMASPAVPWYDAIALSLAGCVVMIAVVSTPWFSYRTWTRNAPWRMFLSFGFVITLVVFAGFASVDPRPLRAIESEKVLRALAVAILVGVAVSSLMVAISRFRLREELQRAASEAERERLERQKIQAELKLLQAQVEPHFLFNTLANLRHLIQADPPAATAMLDHLIRYLRTALPEIRGEGSTLGRELQLARAYLDIMRLRMGNTLEIGIDVPDALATAPFPPLMLMTLVENAIKHGVGRTGRGRVTILAREYGGKLLVMVQDDGPGLGGALGDGVGLANVRERLAALFGARARLDLESPAEGGTRASIEVPAHGT